MPYEKLKDEQYNNLGGVNVKGSAYITGDGQFLDIRNYCFERPNALRSRPGISDTLTLAKSTYGATPTSLYQFTSPNWATTAVGASFLVFDSGNNLYFQNDVTLFSVFPSLAGQSIDFVTEINSQYTNTQKDYLYFANGQDFRLYSSGSGSTVGIWPYSLAIQYNFPVPTSAPTVSSSALGTTTAPIAAGTHIIKIVLGKAFDNTATGVENAYFSEDGPPAYRYEPITLSPGFPFGFDGIAPNIPGYGYNCYAIKWTSPATGIERTFGPDQNRRFSQDSVTFAFTFQAVESFDAVSGIASLSLAPRFLETYKNMLFMSGFSGEPHRIRHSDIGAFLFFAAQNQIEVLPGQSTEITCLKKFQDSLIVFKDSSVYEIRGDSPETLSVKTITTEYGCVNNRAAVTFENKLWFVDKKGICEYNGPDTFIVSYPVEEFFKDLDPNSFKALHVKSENQVWFASDNVVLVYDYEVGAWTIYDNIPISSNAASEVIEYGQTLPMPTWVTSGTSHFFISRLDRSVNTDRGQNITLILQTKYHKRMGDSTQELFRRLFLDYAPGLTNTPTIAIELRPDYGSSVYSTLYSNLDSYQSRLDFGISAKALSVRTILSSGEKVTFNGYTIESRYLRGT